MRRVIGIDIHRTFGEVVIWEGGILRREGRVEMTRTALKGADHTSHAPSSRCGHGSGGRHDTS